MNLGNHFASARKKAGLSQEEVAEKLGVSRQTISSLRSAITSHWTNLLNSIPK